MGLLVISNRVPAPRAGTGAGGLAVALKEALSASGGTWLGWSGRRAVDRQAAPSVTEQDGIRFTTLDLSEHDFSHYYTGYANSVLWPLFHEQLHAMKFHDAFAQAYQDVNAYFADAAAEAIEPGDVVWVHDYHFIPLGAALRDRGVPGCIGFFLHIPFPPFDVLRALPGHRTLLRSFLAYDLVGFQSASDAGHFADALVRGLGATVDLQAGTATLADRHTSFGAFPIGIDVAATARMALTHRASREGQRLTRALRGRQLVIGADRLDYTKGLVERLRAFEAFLEQHGREVDDRMIYVQITAPSREDVREYRSMSRQLEAMAGRINGQHSSIYWTPLRLIEQQVPRDTLLGYFSLADVGLVTPLRDGMNLVAKEFLAAQTPEDPGVLVLSSLAGAAEELADSAVIVQPYSTHSVAQGIHQALTMPLEERRHRWETAMEKLEQNTANMWRERFLTALYHATSAAAPAVRRLRPVS